MAGAPQTKPGFAKTRMCPSPSSALCPFLYRTEHFSRGRKGRKCAEKRGGRGVARKGGKKEKRTRENKSVKGYIPLLELLVLNWGLFCCRGWKLPEGLTIVLTSVSDVLLESLLSVDVSHCWLGGAPKADKRKQKTAESSRELLEKTLGKPLSNRKVQVNFSEFFFLFIGFSVSRLTADYKTCTLFFCLCSAPTSFLAVRWPPQWAFCQSERGRKGKEAWKGGRGCLATPTTHQKAQ